MSPPRLVLHEDDRLRDAVGRLREAKIPGAPVIDSEGRFLGTVTLAELLEPAEKNPDGPLGRRVDATAPSTAVSATLDQAIDALPATVHWLTVLDQSREVRGIVAFSDIVRAYHRTLRSDARAMRRVASNAGLVDVEVGPRSALVGHRLNEDVLPDGIIVVAVRRADSMLLGLGAVHLEAGDQVTVLTRSARTEDLRSLFDGTVVE
ncbi:MAG: CBS domain-containing protein, partial [Mycobacteriaceae bacterium]